MDLTPQIIVSDIRFCTGCGHSEKSHEHYRAGTECGIEGCDCTRFKHRTVSLLVFWVLITVVVVVYILHVLH